MGTEYKLYNDENFGELSVGEMSNKLEFLYNHTRDFNLGDIAYSEEMTPEEMAKIFLYGLTVCSYWMDGDKLREMIEHHIKKSIY